MTAVRNLKISKVDFMNRVVKKKKSSQYKSNQLPTFHQASQYAAKKEAEEGSEGSRTS